MAPLKNLSESELVIALRNKDKQALDYLYDRYSGALYGVIFRIVTNKDVAEEVLQDVFLRIWQRFDQYDASKGKLFTWMVNIARNQSIDKLRSKEINKESKTGGMEKIVNTSIAAGQVEQATDDIGIRDVLKVLPEDQKFVVEHLYFKGYTQSELADEFNIPLGTVKTRLRLSMQVLRKFFQGS